MFSIGDFARRGLVSVRMLRHYDAIGLLRPAHVDPASGYRFYQAGQFARLNRVIALKDLGFTLQHVQAILDDQVSVEELHGMLRLRAAELEAAIAADTARLARVQARLRAIENEGRMPTDDVLVKRITPSGSRNWWPQPPVPHPRTSDRSSSHSSPTSPAGWHTSA